MRITYRGTGGLWTLLVLSVIGIVGALVMVTVVAAVAIGAVAAGTILVLARAFGWRPWRRTAVSASAPAPFAGETIEGTVVSSEPAEGDGDTNGTR